MKQLFVLMNCLAATGASFTAMQMRVLYEQLQILNKEPQILLKQLAEHFEKYSADIVRQKNMKDHEARRKHFAWRYQQLLNLIDKADYTDIGLSGELHNSLAMQRIQQAIARVDIQSQDIVFARNALSSRVDPKVQKLLQVQEKARNDDWDMWFLLLKDGMKARLDALAPEFARARQQQEAAVAAQKAIFDKNAKKLKDLESRMDLLQKGKDDFTIKASLGALPGLVKEYTTALRPLVDWLQKNPVNARDSRAMIALRTSINADVREHVKELVSGIKYYNNRRETALKLDDAFVAYAPVPAPQGPIVRPSSTSAGGVSSQPSADEDWETD